MNRPMAAPFRMVIGGRRTVLGNRWPNPIVRAKLWFHYLRVCHN
jgi:hypothetical protein